MRLVRQRLKYDCGIATAAMVAGTTWSKAMDADPAREHREIGLHCREFVAMCHALGAVVRVSVAGRGLPFREAPRPERAVAAIIRRVSAARGHYVAIHGDEVLDPERGRFAAKRVDEDWLVVRWFVRSA